MAPHSGQTRCAQQTGSPPSAKASGPPAGSFQAGCSLSIVFAFPGLRAAPARTGAGKPGFYDYYSYKITSVDADQILAPEGSSPLGRSRAGVLGILRAEDGPLGIREVARHAGLHPNTARFHLEALVNAGLAARSTEDRGTPGRPRIAYRATGPDARPGHRRAAGAVRGAGPVRRLAGHERPAQCRGRRRVAGAGERARASRGADPDVVSRHGRPRRWFQGRWSG
jgi:DNA-binding transcriptional ArsR family regulator